MISDEQFERLRQDGWVLFPGAVSSDLVTTAIEAMRSGEVGGCLPSARPSSGMSFCC